MVSLNTGKTEYWGNYIVSIKHYDRWNEWIYQTCEVPCGTDSEGNTTYCTVDCSYVENHPEYWTMVDDNKKEYEITKKTFENTRDQWNTPMVFIDMKRKYHTIDGDAQSYAWDNDVFHSVTVTNPHSYKNKIQASQSVFNFTKLDKKEVETLGLYSYPEVVSVEKGSWLMSDIYLPYQSSIIGFKGDIHPDTLKEWDFVNGYYGKSHEFRTYLLCYYNKSVDISMKQRTHWIGGNKNEFIITVGLDSLSNKILWTNTFGWSDDKSMSILTEQYLNKRDTLFIGELSHKLSEWIPVYWKRKNFSDFDYLKPVITQKQMNILSTVLFVLGIGLMVYMVRNKFTNR
jgi:hypothetical protein